MTDQSDILSGGEVAPQQTATAAVSNPEPATTVDPNKMFADKLKEIRNEEGLQKYASVEDALVGTAHAQQFIQTLKEEKAALMAQLEAERQAREEAMSSIASTQQASVTAQPTVGREDVYSMMKDYEQAKAYQSNRKSVVDTLVNHCNGDQVKAAEMITNKLKELGMGRDELALLSERSPGAVKKLFGLDGMGTSTSKALESTINTDAMETHRKPEVQPRKPMPIGAGNDQLVNEWRASVSEANQKLGIE